MKRLRLFVCILLSCFLLSHTTAYAYYDPLTSKQYDDLMDPLHFEKGLPNLNNISGTMGTYVIKNTPSAIWDLFFQEGVNIYVTQSVPKSERTQGGNVYDGICYSATFSYNGSNKITKVSAPVSIYIYHNTTRADTYIHECGHALDYIAEYITGTYRGSQPISNSSEWQNLYATYGSTMATFDGNASVNMYNASEAFAEAYRLYFTYPSQLQSRCPEVYNFVSSQIAKYTAYVPALSYSNFDYISYAASYPDVAQAVGANNKQGLWDHYVNHGKAEGRVANKIIKVKR